LQATLIILRSKKWYGNFYFRETQEMIEPMKNTLKDIDNNIKTQLDKIRHIKAQVMKNEQKIRRLLNGNL